MEKFSLEVESWGNWELEKDFSSFDRAFRHGRENFAQNEWRIIDRISGNVVHTHNLETSARDELTRFAETARWRQRYAEQAAADVVARQQRERMVELAARQRARQRESDQRRRDRLGGFRFVGAQPAILNFVEATEYLFGNEETPFSRKRSDRVNWLKEGF